MVYLLALASAVVYGASDFLGGVMSRRISTIAIVVVAQGAGLIVLGSVLPFLPASSPGPSDWAWGGLAGLTGGIGVGLLYRALAVGTMAVVAPVTAVCAVAIPVVASLALGERLGARAAAGIALAIVAIVLVSQQDAGSEGAGAPSQKTAGLGLALASGVGIGLFFLALAHTSEDAGLWPVFAARVVSVTLFAVAAIGQRLSLRMSRPDLATVIVVGVTDMLANLMYLLATRQGALSIVVTLSSLYPASTVLLARFVLGERLNARQSMGIVCAMVAVVLIVSGS